MVLFFAAWVMVGIMRTTRRCSPGSTASSMAVGLLMLALMLVASSPAWSGGDPVQRTTVGMWAPGAWIAQSSMVRAASTPSDHVPALWQPRNPLTDGVLTSRPVRHAPAWTDPGTIRSPQQTAQRIVDSRSPPVI